MKRSVSFNGLTPAGRARARHRAFSGESLLLTMQAVGMSRAEIRSELEQLQAARPKCWRVYYSDGEAARQVGDPLLGIVEATTREEAEAKGRHLPAYRSHVGSVWVGEDEPAASSSAVPGGADRQHTPKPS